MIRINLLPAKEVKKPVAGQTFIVVALFLIVAEIGALYFWYSSKEDDLTNATNAAKSVEKQAKAVELEKKELEKKQKERDKIALQNGALQRLQSVKAGPVEMLQFISYCLKPRVSNEASIEEIQDLEKAGWQAGWAPNRVWLTSVSLEDAYLVMRGLALEHTDVAEFLYRIDSGIYFVRSELIETVRTNDTEWPEQELVEFEIQALFNHDRLGTPKYTNAELPEEFKNLVKKEAPKPDEKAKDKGDKGKADKDAKGAKKGS